MTEITMLMITAVSILALAGGYTLSRLCGDGKCRLSEPRGDMLTVGVQIICGDCSGEGDHPVHSG